jgi:fumarate reductase flavoprotein subunit
MLEPILVKRRGTVPLQSHEVCSVDVLVIGGGASGLAAAVRARQCGAQVLLAEKREKLGGTTLLSVGSITAAGTRLQRRAGVVDSVDDFLEDMEAFDPELLTGDNPILRQLLAGEAATSVAWLEDLGVAFTGPYPEAPHRVPRMHNVIPNSRAYITRLTDAARREGVDIMVEADVHGLTRDSSGEWTATIEQPGGASRRVRARGGVVIATGDFSGNADMRHEYLSRNAAAARPSNPDANGDGHRLAREQGGQLRAMHATFGPQLRFAPSPKRGLIERLPTWRWLCKLEAQAVQRLPASALRPFVKSLLITHMSPSAAMFQHGAILVNAKGERFCDEKASTESLSFQEGGKGYLVFDAGTVAAFNRPPNAISTAPGIAFAYFDDYRRGRPDLVHEAESSGILAKAIGCDPQRLQSTLEEAGLRPGFYALGPVFSMLTVTEGGLSVDQQLRVLDESGTPIEGLYAVGGVGQGGMLLKGHGHHIAWAMTSGRVAGEAAARRILSAKS